jgi:hypothetical protein
VIRSLGAAGVHRGTWRELSREDGRPHEGEEGLSWPGLKKKKAYSRQNLIFIAKR